MVHTNILCNHGPCVCEVAEQGMFCSGYCKEAWEDNVDDPACKCGHATCKEAQRAGSQEQPEPHG